MLAILLLALLGPRDEPIEITHDFATLTEAQALRLEGKRALFRVVKESAPDTDTEGAFTLFDCEGEGDVLRTVWMKRYDGEETLTVEATLRVRRYAPAWGFEALTEFRLVDAVRRSRDREVRTTGSLSRPPSTRGIT